MQRSHYAARQISGVGGVDVKFAVRLLQGVRRQLRRHRRTVAEINAALREHGIFGGKDLSADFPELGQCALYCVTEIHTQNDIDRLTEALREEIAR